MGVGGGGGGVAFDGSHLDAVVAVVEIVEQS